MEFKLGRDVNGNKLLKVSFGKGNRGFSVQTMGNLPRVHRATSLNELSRATVENELHAFVKEFGTERQKDLLGW